MSARMHGHRVRPQTKPHQQGSAGPINDSGGYLKEHRPPRPPERTALDELRDIVVAPD